MIHTVFRFCSLTKFQKINTWCFKLGIYPVLKMMHPTVILILSLLCGLGSSIFPRSETVSKNVNDLKYFYIPSAGQAIEIAFNNVSSLNDSNLTAGIRTVVLIDGFMSNVTSPASTVLSESYASLGDTNVIILDWGSLSGAVSPFGGNIFKTAGIYLEVLGNVAPIGQRLAEFLNFLRVNKQISFSNVTIVGHSLGAHIAGAAGVAIRKNYNSVISRIVGLDPAGPFFSLQIFKDKRLFKGQASFVDIYHTNRGQLGDIDHNTGNVNIYVNGGKNQPGCRQADSMGLQGYCSHSYAWKFFNAAFNNSIVACPCTGLFALLQCTSTSFQNSCRNGIEVGPNIDTSARGPFRVTYGSIV